MYLEGYQRLSCTSINEKTFNTANPSWIAVNQGEGWLQ